MPPPKLLVHVQPLAKPGEIPVTEQADVMAQYAEDIGRFNLLLEEHTDLQDWIVKQCLQLH